MLFLTAAFRTHFLGALFLFAGGTGYAQKTVKIRNSDRKKEVLLTTTEGMIRIRLYPETPLHRDNFLRLVKSGLYTNTFFHRVIPQFVVQGGDPKSKVPTDTTIGNGEPSYTVPAELDSTLFHRRGTVGAARNDNPAKASSGSQFYFVQGKKYTEKGLDSVEARFKVKIPPAQRMVYTTEGGLPTLDRNYTVFGEVVQGMEVIDKIAAMPTVKSHTLMNRPAKDVVIVKAKLVRRKRR